MGVDTASAALAPCPLRLLVVAPVSEALMAVVVEAGGGGLGEELMAGVGDAGGGVYFFLEKSLNRK